MTIVNHHVMHVEHSKSGKVTNQRSFAIAIASFNDGSDEVWQYGDAKFSSTFINYTEELYRLRQPLFYPKTLMEKYIDTFLVKPDKQKQLETGAPHY